MICVTLDHAFTTPSIPTSRHGSNGSSESSDAESDWRPNRRRDRLGVGVRFPRPGGGAVPDAGSYSNAMADGDADALADAHRNSIGGADAFADPYGDPNAHPFADVYRNPTSLPDGFSHADDGAHAIGDARRWRCPPTASPSPEPGFGTQRRCVAHPGHRALAGDRVGDHGDHSCRKPGLDRLSAGPMATPAVRCSGGTLKSMAFPILAFIPGFPIRPKSYLERQRWPIIGLSLLRRRSLHRLSGDEVARPSCRKSRTGG